MIKPEGVAEPAAFSVCRHKRSPTATAQVLPVRSPRGDRAPFGPPHPSRRPFVRPSPPRAQPTGGESRALARLLHELGKLVAPSGALSRPSPPSPTTPRPSPIPSPPSSPTPAAAADDRLELGLDPSLSVQPSLAADAFTASSASRRARPSRCASRSSFASLVFSFARAAFSAFVACAFSSASRAETASATSARGWRAAPHAATARPFSPPSPPRWWRISITCRRRVVLGTTAPPAPRGRGGDDEREERRLERDARTDARLRARLRRRRLRHAGDAAGGRGGARRVESVAVPRCASVRAARHASYLEGDEGRRRVAAAWGGRAGRVSHLRRVAPLSCCHCPDHMIRLRRAGRSECPGSEGVAGRRGGRRCAQRRGRRRSSRSPPTEACTRAVLLHHLTEGGGVEGTAGCPRARASRAPGKKKGVGMRGNVRASRYRTHLELAHPSLRRHRVGLGDDRHDVDEEREAGRNSTSIALSRCGAMK